jgi:hypothetical protein
MKQLIIVYFLLIFTISCKSTAIPLHSIKLGIVAFIKDVERTNTSVNDWPDFIISNKDGYIEEGKEGIFNIGTQVVISSGGRIHFLLVEKDSFQILNMSEPIDQNILKLSDFLKRNKQYSKQDVLFYIGDVIKVHQYNEKYIKSFNGIFR